MDESISVRLGTAADLPRVQPLWEALYVDQAQQGMVLAVPPGSFASWRQQLEPVLGRFGCLVVAESAGALRGFVAGRIRPIPPYFGGGTAGFVGEVYTAPEARGRGAARRMLAVAADFFAEGGARRMELQVVPGNEGARAAYRKLGWREELVQMTVPLGGNR